MNLLSKLLYHGAQTRNTFVRPSFWQNDLIGAGERKLWKRKEKEGKNGGEKGNIIRWNRTHDLFGGGSRWEIRTRGMHRADSCPMAEGELGLSR